MDSWTTSGLDLHVDLTGPDGVRACLMAALRDGIRSGRLAPGSRLPSSRTLAVDLGVARGTVADAYAELVAEGWLTARQGSATRVAERAGPGGTAPSRVEEDPAGPAHDLRPGSPDASSFPRAAWLRSARRALAVAPSEAFGPGDPRGRRELRTALVAYLARVRGVRTDPDHVVVCSGVLDGLRLLTGVIAAPLAVEEHGLHLQRLLLDGAGLRTVPIPVDEHGARVAELPGGVSWALLTPAHQYPLGGPLHPSRRAGVVGWAGAAGGTVLEDDYDGEFRYDRRPVGALQGLDPDRVLLLGSVTKSLSSAVRVGWMVVPDRLLDQVVATKGERERWVGVVDQLTLADLISSGAYDRHVRAMRHRYRRRRDALVRMVAERAPGMRVSGIAAGLHAVLDLPAGSEDAALQAAAREGVAVAGLRTYRHPASTAPPRDGLIVSYGTPPEHGYRAAIEALGRALETAPPELPAQPRSTPRANVSQRAGSPDS